MKTEHPLKSVFRSVDLLTEMEALVIRGGYAVSPNSTYDKDCSNNCDCPKPNCPCPNENCLVVVGGDDCKQKP